MRYASIAVGALLSAAMAVSNCQANFLWDGSGNPLGTDDPPTNGDFVEVGTSVIDPAYYLFDTNGFDESGNPIPEPGYMTQDTVTLANSTYATHFHLKDDILATEMVSANGYVVEWRANAIYANPADPFPFEIAMQIADDHSGVLLSMFPDSIKYYAGSGPGLIDVPIPAYSPGFHTFKVRKAAGKTNFAISVDGGAYVSIPGSTSPDYTNYLEFGDSSSGSAPSNGIGVWDYISITSPSPSIPGDYNSDTVVDSLDYDTWKATFGSATDLAADGNENFEIDAADYVVWRNFVAPAAVGAAAIAVPEPSGIVLLIVAAAIGLVRRRRAALDCVSSGN